MTHVEKIETKVYTNTAGWTIWLCTYRTPPYRVKSCFKVQRVVNDTVKFSKELIGINEYIDSVDVLAKNELWTGMSARYQLDKLGDDRNSKTFIQLLNSLYADGTLEKKIKEHNSKTLHKLDFLPDNVYEVTKHSVFPYMDMTNGYLAAIIFHKVKGSYSIEYKALATDSKGASFIDNKTVPVVNDLLRPEAISNTLFSVLNPILDKARVAKEVRKDIVADILECFEKGRFAFWTKIHEMNQSL